MGGNAIVPSLPTFIHKRWSQQPVLFFFAMTSNNSAVVEIFTDGINFRNQLTPKQLGFTLEKTDDAVRAEA